MIDRRASTSSAVALMAVLASIGPGVASAQSAPSARARATRALTHVDLSRCAERTEWAGRRVQAALVVFPDGAYGVALGAVTPAMGRDDDRAGLARCIETSLGLGVSVPLPPRSAFVITRELDVPSSAELTAAIRSRLDASRADFEECVRERAHPSLARIDVEARVEVRGGRVVAVGSRSEASGTVAHCVRRAAGDASDLPDGAGVVTATVTREHAPPGTLPRSDGTRGAICHWGEREVAQNRGRYVLPEPRPCRAGLRCCYGGGVAGLSSSCIPARGGCPRYP